jgi:hypothetical protein
MAGKVMGFEKAFKELEAMDISDEDANKILSGAADIALPVMRDNLNRVLSDDATGELAGALGITPVRLGNTGTYTIKVGFRENGRGTMTNFAKAVNLEYGNSRGQPPRPWFKKSVNKTRKPITEFVLNSVLKKVQK